jgi:hypothetical protein
MSIVVKEEQQREIWSHIMKSKDKIFELNLSKSKMEEDSGSFDGIDIVSLKKLMKISPFSESTADPRDILGFVEKCVDERFVYTRQLPASAAKDPIIKYNYRQLVVDFGVPGVGCMYSPRESEIICEKIARFLQKNQIPVFIAEAHEGCGAVAAKMSASFSFKDSDPTFKMVCDEATKNANQTSTMVKKIAKKSGYKLKTYSKFATIETACFRVEDGLNEHIARIHNGSGVIVLPNFLDKKAHSKVFLPDKFCLANDVCMFNMIDAGLDFDKNSQNSTAAYIVFCIKIMLGKHGLGKVFFRETPLTLLAACDTTLHADTLRAYQIFTTVKEILEQDETTKDCLDIFRFVILQF